MISSHRTRSQTSRPQGFWAPVIAVTIAAFILVSSECAPIGLLLQIAQDLEISKGQAGWLVALSGLIASFAAPLTIAFFAAVNRRTLCCFLILALAVSNLTVSLSTDLVAVLAARALLGLSLGGFWTIAMSLGSRLAPPDEAIRATAVIYAGISLGTVAGVPASALLGEWLGWRWAFISLGVGGLGAAMGLLYSLPSLPGVTVNGLGKIPGLLKLPKLRVGLISICLMLTGHFAAYTFCAALLERSFGVTGATLSAFLLSYGIADFIGNWLAGWGAKKSLPGSIAIAATGMGVSLITLAATHSIVIGWVSLVGWGMSFGALPLTIQLYVFSAATDHTESLAAASVSLGQISIAIGALVGGICADVFDVYAAMLLGAGMAASIGILMCWVIHAENQTLCRPEIAS